MIQKISQALLTQGIASAGNFIVSLMVLRLLSLADFGMYAFLFVVAATAGAVASALTGYIYSLHVPRFRLFARSYAEQYNGLNVITTALLTLCTVAFMKTFGGADGQIGNIGLVLFSMSVILTDNLKLQATADGCFQIVLKLEIARQAVLTLAIALWGVTGHPDLDGIVFAHGFVGTLACLALWLSLGRRVRFNRLSWVAARHAAVSRFLLPSTLVNILHGSALQIMAATQFGAHAMGALRAAELPFNATNPVKSSLSFFLPKVFHDVDSMNPRERRALIGRASILTLAVVSIAMFVTWLVAGLLWPIMTNKEYPAAIGAIFAVGYVFMMLLSIVNHYLNVIGQSQIVFVQSAIGAVVAIGVYWATYSALGMPAAAVATAASFLVMTVYGAYILACHLNAGCRPPQPSEAGAHI